MSRVLWGEKKKIPPQEGNTAFVNILSRFLPHFSGGKRRADEHMPIWEGSNNISKL